MRFLTIQSTIKCQVIVPNSKHTICLHEVMVSELGRTKRSHGSTLYGFIMQFKFRNLNPREEPACSAICYLFIFFALAVCIVPFYCLPLSVSLCPSRLSLIRATPHTHAQMIRQARIIISIVLLAFICISKAVKMVLGFLHRWCVGFIIRIFNI